MKQPKNPDHWDAMVAHFGNRQGLAHSDVLNPNEDDDDEDNDDAQPEPLVLYDAPGPKSESGRQKKPVVDRFAAVASVGVDIKEGLMGLGDLVKQALASAPRIGDQTEVINVLKLQAHELKTTNDNFERFFEMQRQQNAQLVESQNSLLQAMALFLQKK